MSRFGNSRSASSKAGKSSAETSNALLALQGNRIDRDPLLYTRPVNAHSRSTAAQLIYSYKVNPRTAIYAGGSYGAFMDDDHPDMFGNSRSVFVKLSYGWQPQF